MNCQQRQRIRQFDAARLGFCSRDIKGDDDVAEIARFSTGILWQLGRGKGQHIRWRVNLTVAAVEIAAFGSADDDHGQARAVMAPVLSEHGLRGAFQLRFAHGALGAIQHMDMTWHDA